MDLAEAAEGVGGGQMSLQLLVTAKQWQLQWERSLRLWSTRTLEHKKNDNCKFATSAPKQLELAEAAEGGRLMPIGSAAPCDCQTVAAPRGMTAAPAQTTDT